MKFLAQVAPFIICANAHSILQRLAVNGADQGWLKGIRAPISTDPIEDVNDADFACNKNIGHEDEYVVAVPAGAGVGAWWARGINRPLYADNVDQPIAASHKGPIMVYLAKVNDAVSANQNPKGALDWFKISQKGLNYGVWAVDELIADGGWYNFTMPPCVPPGQYLMRVEILALHSAYAPGGARFYMECVQIRVQGDGKRKPSSLVKFPGAYSATDPSILVDIYDDNGQPTNRGKPYKIPGPEMFS
ncbi:glycosyl hydrolase family 61 [Colletotrichum graminicola]|uniref:lytic cellulose monooxygenase (C4-dehydrogenating) n=1 Tax=Colletotrichum graminicola (strain M1.001 / M2 / FGSC 10212) TaxID=645133 RepID=E3QVD9_COLGM|nr:glycosyl hydrolase family 61 [Colletotrichum graminicola M1.001]EFQ34827.1 glycosyl hydrolase family 61 [Colletotrichum graminicola M1.001]WDK10371.1 glycosyl hydrolase family 61 [Colletotrichum graminicola]